MLSHHDFWWRFFPKKELGQIYLSIAIRALSISMLGLFIPLYLHLEIGISLTQTLLFYLLYSIIFAIATPLAAKFSSRYGVRHTMLFSLPFYIIFIGGLYFLPHYPLTLISPLMIIAMAAGISWSFYWLGLHLIFYHASHRHHRGEEVGKQKSITILATMFGPIAGAVLIVNFGFQVVFLLGILLLTLALGILFVSKENNVRYHFSFKSMINGKDWRNSLYFVSRGSMVMASGVIWPLSIFAVLGSYISLGFIGTIISGVSAILVLLIGKYSDHKNKRLIVRWVIGFEAVSWIIKALATTIGQIFGATIFGAVTYGALESPLGAMEYDQAKSEIASYFVNREVFICLGRILILVVVLMTGSLANGLLFQGMASLLALLF